MPVCFYPESVRGAAISDLNTRALEDCTEIIHDEGHDAASTSHNFLERGTYLHNTIHFSAQHISSAHFSMNFCTLSYHILIFFSLQAI